MYVAIPPLVELQHALSTLAGQAPDRALRSLLEAGHGRLPLPGHGDTIARWRTLAAIAEHDLSLAKLFEGHTDALAILAEAGAAPDDSVGIWGTWCAEPPDARLTLAHTPDGTTVARGRKAWCSGAHMASHAVVSCWDETGAARLAAVHLRQRGVTITDDGWHAVGMQATRSVDVLFEDVPVTPLGGADFYVQRAGFWHGGAGVAACWFGAATRLAEVLRARLAEQGDRADPHRLAQLGQVSVALRASAAMLREAAAAIDQAPQADAMALALSVRLGVEAAATLVLNAVGRALGAGPLCKDAAFARLYADLPVFMRQSHAERDQEALGRAVALETKTPWML